MGGRGLSRGHALDGGVDGRGQGHVLEGNSHAQVESLRQAVVRVDHRGLGLEVDLQVRANEVALEEQARAVSAAVGVFVGEVQLEVPAAEVASLERVPGRLLIVHAEGELALAGGQRPLGKDRSQRLGRAVVDAEALVEGVGETGRRRADGEGRDLAGDTGVQPRQDRLGPGLRTKVRRMAAGGVGIGGEDDGVLGREEVQEQAGQVPGTLGERSGGGQAGEHNGSDQKTGRPHQNTSQRGRTAKTSDER